MASTPGERVPTLRLRPLAAQDIAEGRPPFDGHSPNDYAVLDDERVIGRVYLYWTGAGEKWLWALEGFPGSLADKREDALAALKRQYERHLQQREAKW